MHFKYFCILFVYFFFRVCFWNRIMLEVKEVQICSIHIHILHKKMNKSLVENLYRGGWKRVGFSMGESVTQELPYLVYCLGA